MKNVARGSQIVVGLMLLGASIPKLAGWAESDREHLGIATAFWMIVAIMELIGVLGMLAGLKYPRLAAAAGVWVTGLMVGALSTHLRAGDGPDVLIGPALVLVLALIVAVTRARSPRAVAMIDPTPRGAGN